MIRNKSFKICLILFIFSLLISILKISKGYTFGWDQADDASKVYSIINQKKPILIGPRVSNDNGFFVGPYHYYFLLPFYLITKGNPIAGEYALLFINALTAVIYFILIKKITNEKIALISALLIPFFLEKICWNVMYSPIIAITAFYICYQAINNKFSFPLACLFAGFISNIHLVPISLVPIIILSFFFSQNKPKFKQIILGFFCFCLPFIPLIIFDIRHDFLNLNKLIFMLSNSNLIGIEHLWIKTFWRNFGLFGILVLIISPFLFKKIKNKILVLTWILFPLLFLSQYHGAISEYYYGMITALIPFFISLFLVKIIKNNFFLFTIILASLVFLTYKTYISKRELITLKDKENIVIYLINQKQDQPFNLSYETEPGFDHGFDYLFKYHRKSPQNSNNAHLYTLFTDKTLPLNTKYVLKSQIYSLVRR